MLLTLMQALHRVAHLLGYRVVIPIYSPNTHTAVKCFSGESDRNISPSF